MTDEEGAKLRADLDAALQRIERLEKQAVIHEADIDNSAKWMAAVANAVVHAIQFISITLNPKRTEDQVKIRDESIQYVFSVRDQLREMAADEEQSS